MKLIIFLSILSILIGAPLHAQDEVLPSEQGLQFIIWDTQHNVVKSANFAGNFVQTESVLLEHVEIPLDHANLYTISDHDSWMYGEAGKQGPNAIILDIAESLPQDIKDIMMFERAGKRYVRYFFSPDDDHYKVQLKEYLKKIGVPYEVAFKYKAYRTASRSLIVYDPGNGRMFSLKPSTRGTAHGLGGQQDRPLPAKFSYVGRRLNDSFEQKKHLMKHLEVAWEPGSIAFPAIDQSYSIRLMESVSRGETYQMSGFVYYDKREARNIAKKAGMSYNQFWREAFFIKGQAMAELTLVLGFFSTSNHPQNFRWELGPDGKLTGRIIFLDISDGSPMEIIFSAYGEQELITKWKNHVKSTNPVLESLAFSNFFRGDTGDRLSPAMEEALLAGIVNRSSKLLNIPEERLKPMFHKIETLGKHVATGHTRKVHYGWQFMVGPEDRQYLKQIDLFLRSAKLRVAANTDCKMAYIKKVLSELN